MYTITDEDTGQTVWFGKDGTAYATTQNERPVMRVGGRKVEFNFSD
jgi:hypothetical protein